MMAMLYKCFFDDFKEEMTYQYGYDSSAETTDEKLKCMLRLEVEGVTGVDKRK